MSSHEAAGPHAGEHATPLVPPTQNARADVLGDVTLPLGPKLPAAARAVVSGWLDGRAPAGLLDDALLLVSELATNSILHGEGGNGDRVRLRAGTYDGSVWFEVGDAGRGDAVTRRTPGADGIGGFGLHLVDQLSSEWGVTHVAGTEVWFVLRLRTPA